MKTQKVLSDYAKLSDANLKVKAENVVVCLTGNTNFPTTRPPLADFTAIQEAYSTALEKTVSGDRILIALKNQARETLLDAMRKLASDINLIANGDKAMLLSSGFDLSATAEPVTSLEPPADFKIRDGLNLGELHFSCKRVPHAVSYIFEYMANPNDPDSRWVSQSTSSREFTFKNLISGTRVQGRARVIGHRDLESISEIQSRIVQ